MSPLTLREEVIPLVKSSLGLKRKAVEFNLKKVINMATCPICRKELHEGFTSLEFHENGLRITVTGIPALVCECGEAVIKSSVAEYISDLVDRIVELERVHYREETKERLYVREVALDVAA